MIPTYICKKAKKVLPKAYLVVAQDLLLLLHQLLQLCRIEACQLGLKQLLHLLKTLDTKSAIIILSTEFLAFMYSLCIVDFTYLHINFCYSLEAKHFKLKFKDNNFINRYIYVPNLSVTYIRYYCRKRCM
jgi:hypothetical protein